MKNFIKYCLITAGTIGAVGCGETNKTTTTTEYPATVTKPATVTDTHSVEVHEDASHRP